MRILMMTAAVLAVSACNRGAANNSAGNAPATGNATAAAPASPAAAPAPMATAGAAGLPDGFLSNDIGEQASACYGFLTVAREAGARPAGHDDPIMEQAANQWLAAVPADASRSQDDLKEQFAPMVAAMASVPAAQRDAAAAWCVENAAQTDPEG